MLDVLRRCYEETVAVEFSLYALHDGYLRRADSSATVCKLLSVRCLSGNYGAV